MANGEQQSEELEKFGNLVSIPTCQACGLALHCAPPGTTFCSERCRRADGWIRRAENERGPYMRGPNPKCDAKHIEALVAKPKNDIAAMTQVFQQQLQALQTQHIHQQQQLQVQLHQQLQASSDDKDSENKKHQAQQLQQQLHQLQQQQLLQLQQHHLQQLAQLQSQQGDSTNGPPAGGPPQPPPVAPVPQQPPQQQPQPAIAPVPQQQQQPPQTAPPTTQTTTQPPQQQPPPSQGPPPPPQQQQQQQQQQQLAQQQMLAQQILQLPPQQQRVVLQHFPPAQQQVLLHLMAQLQQVQPQYFFVNGVGHVMFTPPRTDPNVEPQPVVRQMTPAEQQHIVNLEAQRVMALNNGPAPAPDDKPSDPPVQTAPEKSPAAAAAAAAAEKNDASVVVEAGAAPEKKGQDQEMTPPPNSEEESEEESRPVAMLSDEFLSDAVEPRAFGSRDGVANSWDDAKVLAVRVDSSAKGRSAMTAATRALDEVLTKKEENRSFVDRFAAATREVLQGSSSVVLGWTSKKDDVPAFTEAHELSAVDRLERDFLDPLLTKLWALHKATAAVVKDPDFGLDDFALGYPSDDVGWNQVIISENVPCPSPIDPSDAVGFFFVSITPSRRWPRFWS